MFSYIHILEASNDEGFESSASNAFLPKANVQLPYAGIVIFAWISLVLHRANDALRKQVALKQDYSRLQCVSLAAALMVHVPLIMLCLRQEHLWQRLLFVTPSPAPEVCLDFGTNCDCTEAVLSHPCCMQRMKDCVCYCSVARNPFGRLKRAFT